MKVTVDMYIYLKLGGSDEEGKGDLGISSHFPSVGGGEGSR